MSETTGQQTSRADTALDTSVLSGLRFFSGQNRTKKHKAAILLAEDELTGEAIAQRLKISRSTLYEWRAESEFQQIVGHYHGVLIAEALKLPIAKKHERVKVLNDLHSRALQVIDERTVIENAQPGEGTGLAVRQYKQIGTGRDTHLVEEVVIDTALMREIRALQEQAAKELGQWTERTEVDQRTTTMVQIIGDEGQG